MDFKFSKNSGDSQPEAAPGETKKQRALLVLLLILVGGFTYIYFFTGLIKPQEENKPAEAPAAAPQVVKMPLPPHENGPATPAGKTPEKAEAPKSATAPVKPAAAPSKPAPVAKAAPAQAPAKQKEAPGKAEAKPAEKKPQLVAAAEKKGAAKAQEKKNAAESKKTAPEKKVAAAKEATKKPVSDDKAKSDGGAKSKHAASDSWSIMVGNYVLEEALSTDMGRVRKAGFTPIVKPSARKKTVMNRLLVAEFPDRAEARTTLDKLKRHTSDAFVIEQGGKFAVYAGSYLLDEAVKSEKDRLKAAGFSITVKRVDIAIPSQNLSIGPFKSKKAADAALGKLRNAGIKATLRSK